MRKSVDYRLLVLATLFGVLGGALSTIALPRLAFAQDETPDKIVAHQFQVVDDLGNVVGIFAATPAVSGSPRALEPEGPLRGKGSIMLLSADGSVAWSSPDGVGVYPLSSVPDRQPTDIESQRPLEGRK